MAQLLRETLCVNIWDGYSVNERAERFLGCASEIRCRGCAVDPSVDHTLNALNSSVAEDVMESGIIDNSADISARCASTDDSADIIAACTGTTPPKGFRTSPSE